MHTFHKSQLIGKEKPVEVTLPSGRVITVLDDGKAEIFTSPGRPANFCAVAGNPMGQCHYMFTRLRSGENVQVFVNVETGLVSVDAVKGRTGRAITGNIKDAPISFRLEPLEVVT